MPKAGSTHVDCDLQAFMLYKIQENGGGGGGRRREESLLEYKKEVESG